MRVGNCSSACCLCVPQWAKWPAIARRSLAIFYGLVLFEEVLCRNLQTGVLVIIYTRLNVFICAKRQKLEVS